MFLNGFADSHFFFSGRFVKPFDFNNLVPFVRRAKMKRNVFTLFTALLIISALSFSCNKKEESLSGRLILPAGQTLPSAYMVATMNGQEVAKSPIDPVTGNFTIKLPGPGTYDLLLKTPKGNLPFILSISVEKGQQAAIDPFDAPADLFESALPFETPPATQEYMVSTSETHPPSGGETEGAAVTLKGTVHPADALVKVIAEDKIVFQVKAADGKFEIPSVRPGLYEIEFSAPGYANYAQEDVTVMVDAPPADLNGFLLYVSPLDGINWDKGIITATGLGKPTPGVPQAAANAGACRAAQADAYRKLLDVLLQIQIDPNKSIASMDADGKIKTTLSGFVQGVKPVRQVTHDDGICEVTLELPLYGPSGVTTFLQQQVLK